MQDKYVTNRQQVVEHLIKEFKNDSFEEFENANVEVFDSVVEYTDEFDEIDCSPKTTDARCYELIAEQVDVTNEACRALYNRNL